MITEELAENIESIQEETIEIISASQNIQDLLDKAKLLVRHGVKAVWMVELFGSTIFITTKDGENRYHNQEVESENIKVDFRQIFATS